MTKVKERLIGAITVMGEEEAEKLWNILVEKYAWSDIEETEPDEFNLKMLKSIKENPDCKEFISQEDVMKELGIS